MSGLIKPSTNPSQDGVMSLMFRQAVFRDLAVPVKDKLSDVPGLFGKTCVEWHATVIKHLHKHNAKKQADKDQTDALAAALKKRQTKAEKNNKIKQEPTAKLLVTTTVGMVHDLREIKKKHPTDSSPTSSKA